MPSSSRETVLCRYHYDPLDRQNGCTVPQQPPIQQFHNKDRLTTEIHGASRWSFFQHDEQLLAQRMHQDANATTALLATDQQRSVLNVLDTTQPNPLAYTPYGHRPAENRLLSLLGFNGERADSVTGHYHLGNGYRQFNPVLMRFNSPDSWSPFGEGGFNTYGYCAGDPVNRSDPSGHMFKFLFGRGLVSGITKNMSKTEKLAPHTKALLKQTKADLGGSKKIKKVASDKNISAERYLLSKAWNNAVGMETKYTTILNKPHPYFLDDAYNYNIAKKYMPRYSGLLDDIERSGILPRPSVTPSSAPSVPVMYAASAPPSPNTYTAISAPPSYDLATAPPSYDLAAAPPSYGSAIRARKKIRSAL